MDFIKNPVSDTPVLPFFLARHWTIKKILSVSPEHTTILTVDLSEKNKTVFQIIPHSSFHPKVFQRLSKISDTRLLLPEKHYYFQRLHYLQFSYILPLTKKISDHGISLTDILQLGVDLSQALHTLHQNHMLHLDITPGNIYCTSDNHFLLGDFSSSVLFSPVYSMAVPASFHTPGYTAPECLTGQCCCHSDQYGLAALLYTLCNDGIPPSPDPTDSIRFTSDNPVNDETLSLLLPVLQKALHPDPSLRYSGLSAFQKELTKIKSGLSSHFESCYFLHLPDTEHPFFQLKTLPLTDSVSPIKQSQHKLFSPTLCLLYFSCLLFLLSIFHFLSLCFKPAVIPYNQTPSAFSSYSLTASPAAVTLDPAPIPSLISSASASPPPAIPSVQKTDMLSTEADISNCSASSIIKALPPHCNIKRIRVLYSENNLLENVDELHSFSSLKELYLSNNKITHFSVCPSLYHLRILILSDNILSDVSSLSQLHELHFLDLSGNSHLSNVLSLSKLTTLSTLVLTDTNVTRKEYQFLKKKLPHCTIIY